MVDDPLFSQIASPLFSQIQDTLSNDISLPSVPANVYGVRMAASPLVSAGTDPSSVADDIMRKIRAINPASGSVPFSGAPTASRAGSSDSNVPSYTDVWYIHVGIPVLPPWSYSAQGAWYSNENLSSRVYTLISSLVAAAGGVSMLKCPRGPSDISSSSNNGIDVIKEARYECMDGGRPYRWPSSGPKLSRSGQDGLCAYIAFPVGPIGPAVRTLSLIVEEITDAMILDDNWSRSTSVVTGLSSFMPPKTGGNDCYGLHLVEDYTNFTVNSVEYPAKDFDGVPSHKTHSWLRYYFKSSCKFLIPGEFIGLTIIPEPPYCWWYQRSSPLLYSGAFFETRFYTSGKIVKILSKEERGEGVVGEVYVVCIRGVNFYLQSSDFVGYDVGEKVAVLKVDSVTSTASSAFSWLDLEDLFALSESLSSYSGYTLLKSYVIVPFTFYKQ